MLESLLKRFFIIFSLSFNSKLKKWWEEKTCILRSLVYGHEFGLWGGKNKLGKFALITHPECIFVGSRNHFDSQIYLTAWTGYGSQTFSPKIKIGNDCKFGACNHISCVDQIEIGDGFLSGKWVTIVDNGHGRFSEDDLAIKPALRDLYSKGPVFIGKNVWVGDKVTILPNITIGDGAVIAANTVVTKDVPPFSLCAGNPGTIIRTLERENE